MRARLAEQRSKASGVLLRLALIDWGRYTLKG